MIVHDVFSSLPRVRRLAQSADYRQIEKMFLAVVPGYLDKHLRELAEKHTGDKFVSIATVFRHNNSFVDNQLRIHSDDVIQGQQPDYATVTYLKGGGSGTGFFSHIDFGSHWKKGDPKVHKGKGWKLDEYQEPIDNSMLIYEADRYHCRYPFATASPRFVICQFLRKL